MEAFLQVEAAHAGTIWEEKTKSKWRRSCFLVHAGRQGVVDRWVSHQDRMTRQLVPGDRPLLAWGSGKFHTAQRGNTAAPLGTLQHALWQRFPVVMVDEAYTSKYAYEAEEKLYEAEERSGAMRRARLSGVSCGTKTPLTLSGAASSAVTRTQRSTSTAYWFAERLTAPATFPGYLAKPRCK
jgi:hypothetical protein